MSFSQDLLDQAQHLLEMDAKKPKQASLRRAVSTSYYALFHLLIERTTSNWKGQGSQADRKKQRNTLARMFEHKHMKTACKNKGDDLRAELKVMSHTDSARSPKDKLRQIVETFVTMQENRHTADYDGTKKWTKTEVTQKVESVGVSFANWTGIQDTPESQLFLISLLLKERK